MDSLAFPALRKAGDFLCGYIKAAGAAGEESIGVVIIESRRREDNLSRKERYHCYSLDAEQFEGAEYSDVKTPESILISEECSGELQGVLGSLTEMPGWRWEFAEAEKIQADKIQGKGQPL